jgi:hypothetical protein
LFGGRNQSSGRFLLNLGREGIADRTDDLTGRGENPQECERSSVYDGSVIYENLEFSVLAVNQVNLGAELSTNERRHTDGMNPGDSIAAIADGDSAHGASKGASRVWRSAAQLSILLTST